jgi:hypothetical protein
MIVFAHAVCCALLCGWDAVSSCGAATMSSSLPHSTQHRQTHRHPDVSVLNSGPRVISATSSHGHVQPHAPSTSPSQALLSSHGVSMVGRPTRARGNGDAASDSEPHWSSAAHGGVVVPLSSVDLPRLGVTGGGRRDSMDSTAATDGSGIGLPHRVRSQPRVVGPTRARGGPTVTFSGASNGGSSSDTDREPTLRSPPMSPVQHHAQLSLGSACCMLLVCACE